MLSPSLNTASAGSLYLTGGQSAGVLPTDRSALNDPLMQVNPLRTSAAALSATPDAGNTLGAALNLGTLGNTPITRSDSVGSSDRNDYYRFSVTTNTNFNLTLSGMSANADLELLGANGVAINRSNRSGNVNETINRWLRPGTYYIRVYQTSGDTSYTLRLANATSAPAPTPTPTPTPTPNFVQRVLELTNQFRSQNGVAPLRLNVELNAASLNHSRNMALQDFFSHAGRDGSSAGDRMRQVGYQSNAWGENIAAGYTTPEQVVQGWINSPGHRANLLNRSFTELGVGYYHLVNDTGGVNYNHYWTQNFGSGDTNPATNLPA